MRAFKGIRRRRGIGLNKPSWQDRNGEGKKLQIYLPEKGDGPTQSHRSFTRRAGVKGRNDISDVHLLKRRNMIYTSRV